MRSSEILHVRSDPGLLEQLVDDGRPALILAAAALAVSGAFAIFLSMRREFLPHDVSYLGMSAHELCAVADCRVVGFMFHDRVAFGGTLIAISVLYAWMAAVPLRAREAWAWWAFAVSGVLGFGSFLAYLGYGYLDSWHAAATLALLPVFVVGHRPIAEPGNHEVTGLAPECSRPCGDATDASWPIGAARDGRGDAPRRRGHPFPRNDRGVRLGGSRVHGSHARESRCRQSATCSSHRTRPRRIWRRACDDRRSPTDERVVCTAEPRVSSGAVRCRRRRVRQRDRHPFFRGLYESCPSGAGVCRCSALWSQRCVRTRGLSFTVDAKRRAWIVACALSGQKALPLNITIHESKK